jgi:signal peptidase I
MVKRVLGTPGDLVESRNGRLMIGRHTLSETYLREPAASGAIQAQIVPANQLFVMGDNRGDSFDSRNWGTLPRDLVVGRARIILWSSGDGTSAPSAHASTRTDSLTTVAGRWHFTRLFHQIQ